MSSKLEKDVAWESSILGIFYKQLFVHPKPILSTIQLSGQTAIITGANSGLGFEAARQLLHLGLSHLIMAVRSKIKGEAAASKLRSEFPSTKIEVSIVNLSDYDSITEFAKRCRDLEHIDFAILNAALQNSKFEKNDNTGHESVFQTNYLSTTLLVLLLSSIMKEKKHRHGTREPPVLTVVGSDTMYLSKFEASGPVFPRMDNPAPYAKIKQYMDSKLLLMMFVAQLADEISPEDIIINVSNPGLTAGTSLGKDDEKPGFMERYIVPIFIHALGRSTQVGASNYIHALVEEGRESHGSFVSDWAIKPYPALMYKKEGRNMIERLWQETTEELKSIGVDTLFQR
ncbi:putative short-chain dehydrogenase/reductase family protein [Melanomma pulvis-pyrius CBS 109.77]|uniref:Putative short-chain dehydrogenase/reductase family protein n=1 Tax=Melanomma pulvis-pyrius CBS 109.77 TaxID=1314802 RepID=A0A6A6XMQ9_9PLEO|nr:putative short-chain dehydrogenase/reductase family protein [Melanomma pulvis-pyrius CBS 109.77]